MRSSLLMYVRGSVKILIRGNQYTDLINLLVERKVEIWDVEYVESGQVQFWISLKDFFLLKPLLKRSDCRLKVLDRRGLPFLLDKLEGRKYFFIGFIIFLIGLFCLTSLVWKIEIEGNEKIPTTTIADAARKAGIYEFQWKFKLTNSHELANKLMQELDDVSWIGVHKQGTKIKIEVVEATRPREKKLQSPRHIVASTDAVVTDIQALKGNPLVKVHQKVKKGDILISGVIGSEENAQVVVSDGDVRGLVWYEYEIEIPLTWHYKQFTGEARQRSYVVFGSKALKYKGFKSISSPLVETYQNYYYLQWRALKLPFGTMEEEILTYEQIEREIDSKEAVILGLEEARLDLEQKVSGKMKIIEEKILHEKAENGTVYMKVLFEIEQSIVQEQPIVYEQS